MKSESDIVRHDLRNFLLQQVAKLTEKATGPRSGKTSQEDITIVHTVGNEGVGQVNDNVNRKEEIHIRETEKVESTFLGNFFNLVSERRDN